MLWTAQYRLRWKEKMEKKKKKKAKLPVETEKANMWGGESWR